MPESALSPLRSVAIFLFGLLAYATAGLVVPAHLLFVGNFLGGHGLDRQQTRATGYAILIDGCLLLLFFLQHSLMARSGCKATLGRFTPHGIERSLYTMCASVLLLVQILLWQPFGPVLWSVDRGGKKALLLLGYGAGWLLVYWATLALNHFELLGLRQAGLHALGLPYTPVPRAVRPPYRWLRHPLMYGLLLAYWSTPRMTLGHLCYALASSLYIFVGTRFEERDLKQKYS